MAANKIVIQFSGKFEIDIESVENLLSRLTQSGGNDRHSSALADGGGYVPEEVNTKGARRTLTEKGYNVKSHGALVGLLKMHNVRGIKKGRELWYKTAELHRIPARH